MTYVISAENYDPVFCTPYENKYKDSYNPVTLSQKRIGYHLIPKYRYGNLL